MIHSYKNLEEIPEENIQNDLFSFINSNSITDVNSVKSIKHFRISYETFDLISKSNSNLKSLLSSLSDYLMNFIEMSQFIDNLIYELWDFYHMKQGVLEETFFHFILLSLCVFEINILDYVNRLLLGDNLIDLNEIFAQNPDKNIWNTFKHSSYYVNLKESVEKKLQEKKFCLKNNLETLKNFKNLNENFAKMTKAITNNDFFSEMTMNTISSGLASLLKLIFEQYQPNNKEILSLLKSLIMVFDLEKWFFWDSAMRKSKCNFQGFLEERAKEKENAMRVFVNGFRGNEEEIKLNEKLLLFLKKIKK